MSDLDLLTREASRLRARGASVLVATVVDIQGSSYRRVGARMIVSNDRWIAGSVSGGCLEGDVVRRGAHRLRHGSPVVVTYDSTEDDEVGWGLGLGCNGVVKVLLERIDATSIADPLKFAGDCIADQVRGVIVTVFQSADDRMPIGSRLAMRANAPVQATVPEGTLRDAFMAMARQALFSGSSPLARTHVQSIGNIKVLVEVFDPPPTLFICGSNHDAVPLTKFASDLGWRVVIAASSTSASIKDRFAMAEVILAGPPDTLRSELARCYRACAVVMSHDYERDREVLRVLLESKLEYVGVLGPKKRTDRILRELGHSQADDACRALHAPIGLDLGAETPREIALSVIAEIQAALTGSPARRLREKNGPIHHAAYETPEKFDDFVVGAVLAAGASRRLGRPKQLEMFRGKKLVRHVVDELVASSCRMSAVVIGANADGVELAIGNSGAITLRNETWSEGIASSIREAASWAKNQNAKALVLLLADQPLVTRAHIDRIIDAWKNGAPAAGSAYDDTVGVPAIFDASLFDALLALEGDRGAARILREHPGVAIIPWSEGKVDVDTESDVLELKVSALMI